MTRNASLLLTSRGFCAFFFRVAASLSCISFFFLFLNPFFISPIYFVSKLSKMCFDSIANAWFLLMKVWGACICHPFSCVLD